MKLRIMLSGWHESGVRYKYRFIFFWNVLVVIVPSGCIVTVRSRKSTVSAGCSVFQCSRLVAGPNSFIFVSRFSKDAFGSNIMNASSIRRL